ncbi:MAG: hypothetical protein IFJ96_00780 [Acidobacteria bacterium]|nr:hypothetical protein [Candidatus Sulfomarinibacter sp. MAG AM2]
MSIVKYLGTIEFYSLEQVATFVTSLGMLEDAPRVEIKYIPDTNTWVGHIVKGN